MLYFISIYLLFGFIVSNAFEKPMNKIDSGRFLSFTPSNIRLIYNNLIDYSQNLSSRRSIFTETILVSP